MAVIEQQQDVVYFQHFNVVRSFEAGQAQLNCLRCGETTQTGTSLQELGKVRWGCRPVGHDAQAKYRASAERTEPQAYVCDAREDEPMLVLRYTNQTFRSPLTGCAL